MSDIWQDADDWMFDLELQAKYGYITNRERVLYKNLSIIKQKYYDRYKNSKRYRRAINSGKFAIPINGGHRSHPFYKSKFIKKLKGGE